MEVIVDRCIGSTVATPTVSMASETVQESLVEELSALLIQINAAFAVFFGQKWIDRVMLKSANSDISINDVSQLWQTLDLPTSSTSSLPEPLEFASEETQVMLPASLHELELLVSRWIRPFTSSAGSRKPFGIYRALKQGPMSSHFVALPTRYDELYTKIMNQACCPTRGVSPPKEPALCLFCGDVVCAGAACCKRKDMSLASSSYSGHLLFLDWQGVGAATLHASTCGDGLGAFLFIQRSQCLLVTGGRAIFVPAPYVDAHGDTDPNLKRGRPLTLHPERYEALQRLIADHKLSNEVSRTRNSASQILFIDYF
jgi:hypothetical protein